MYVQSGTLAGQDLAGTASGGDSGRAPTKFELAINMKTAKARSQRSRSLLPCGRTASSNDHATATGDGCDGERHRPYRSSQSALEGKEGLVT